MRFFFKEKTTCSISSCQNGGTCYNGQSGGYYCACTSVYSGTNCQTCNLNILDILCF